ncbi:glycosyl transferase [Arthrobacter sp. ERGS1:01]|uniref:DUF1972 domain-containing protein n=1 Tax=Arthrobacter sp. ERGS1:01 TaxID=1704044 RepID=UPI0006CB2112|nr:DUF1972 domain-containing protein [Arthrobacter sp. ERGS1:01]ALE07607.1 glycosyl transferase [Arthrobacter sp. ERGS1:01]
MIGTRGVPAKYGGFETAIEEVGRRLVALGHEVVVYCRSTDGGELPEEYLGMKLVHLPAMRRRSLETLSHTALSVLHLLRHRTDAAIVFNAANSPLLPVIRAARIPVATHVDGLEWKRAKWGPVGQKYYRFAESLSVRLSDALIADAVGIQDYYTESFNARTELITYGAPILESVGSARIAALGLAPGRYHLVVARFEPENHVDLIIEGFVRSGAKHSLVVVGSAPYAEAYTQKLRDLADGRVRFLGGVWDQELLNELYANALVYWHGHSVGGTNPSLLRAIGAGAATNAFDVNFNREVLGEAGRYFRTPDDVRELSNAAEADPAGCRARGELSRREAGRYDWDEVAERYEALCLQLAARTLTRNRGGRRRAAAPGTAVPVAVPGSSTAVPASDTAGSRS